MKLKNSCKIIRRRWLNSRNWIHTSMNSSQDGEKGLSSRPNPNKASLHKITSLKLPTISSWISPTNSKNPPWVWTVPTSIISIVLFEFSLLLPWKLRILSSKFSSNNCRSKTNNFKEVCWITLHLKKNTSKPFRQSQTKKSISQRAWTTKS